MNQHPAFPAPALRSRSSSRGTPARLGALTLAVLFTTSQILAQGPLTSHTGEVQPAATAPPPATGLSAPVPNLEEVSLAKPSSDSLFALPAIQEPSQSSSSAMSNTLSTPTTAKTKPPHHGLGVALSDIGIGALVTGVILYAGESHFCGNSTIKDCTSAKDAGLALMPAGGALMVTGFYFRFHK